MPKNLRHEIEHATKANCRALLLSMDDTNACVTHALAFLDRGHSLRRCIREGSAMASERARLAHAALMKKVNAS